MQQQSFRQNKTAAILQSAFTYWSKTFFYQLIFSLVYLSILFLVYYYSAQRLGILEKMSAILTSGTDFNTTDTNIKALSATNEFRTLSLVISITLAFLYPLNLGFYQIYRKMDLKEKIGVEDLFAGYNGSNFFRYSSYFIFWFFIYQSLLGTVVLGVAWVYLTLFTAPLMFFMDRRIIETVALNWQALRHYFIEITVCIIVAFLFRHAGLIVLVGFLFTFPFWNAVIYAMYMTFFAEKD